MIDVLAALAVGSIEQMPVNDSDAWRELAAHFKELERETGGHLYALWISSSCDENGDWHTGGRWQLAGSDNPREVSFQWAAERGTVLQRGYVGEDALSYWLVMLRAQSPKYETWTPASVANPEEVNLGRIENVCGASAEFCYKVETAAMEAERKANQYGPSPAIEPAMPATDPTETSPSSTGTVDGAISGPVNGHTATADADTNGDLRLSDNAQLAPVPVPPIERYFRKVGETWSVYFDGKPEIGRAHV